MVVYEWDRGRKNLAVEAIELEWTRLILLLKIT